MADYLDYFRNKSLVDLARDGLQRYTGINMGYNSNDPNPANTERNTTLGGPIGVPGSLMGKLMMGAAALPQGPPKIVNGQPILGEAIMAPGESKTLGDIVRYDKPGLDLTTMKPHGMYFSFDSPDFKSPHFDPEESPQAYKATATPKNPLTTEEGILPSERFKGVTSSGAGPYSAGIGALKTLTSPEELSRILKLNKSQLIDELQTKFPGPKYNKYYDAHELREVYGANLARKQGYDAIIQHSKVAPDFSEYVSLTPEAIKPK